MMTQDQITRRLLITSEICLQLQLYAQEITRENVSRAYLESFASRALKRCAELYTLSRPGAFETTATPPARPEAAATPANIVPLRAGSLAPPLNAAVLHTFTGETPDAS